MNIEILFEDENYIAINKPAGLVVHADGRTTEKTVVDWLLEKYPEIKNVGEPMTLSSGAIIERPGIVHRIDRDTSGVLLIAKNQKAFLDLKQKFQNREIEKSYRAFVYGEMKDEDGIIDRPIARSKKDFRLWSAQRGGRGEAREATTEYRIIKRTEFGRVDLGATFVEVSPKTGRTHQIRVHFKAINHPVLCDPLYAPKRKPMLGFARLALHARELSFTSSEGMNIKIEAPFPADFQAAIKEIGA